MRYQKIDEMNLGQVEGQIDTLIAIGGDNPADSLVDEVVRLMKVAQALGTNRKW
jgi:hypothetical protein